MRTPLSATVEEENFFGKHSGVEPEPHRWEHVVIESPDPEFTIMGWQQAAWGYAAVWADENTREAIFDAMKRKEIYATTGPRMTVRFFGGWDFEPRRRRDPAARRRGLCQGRADGRRPAQRPSGKAPTFLVAALKDPYSGNLDRIQIVKGWLDADGQTAGKGLRRRLDATTVSPAPTASCRRSATPSTWRTPPGPTPSATRS